MRPKRPKGRGRARTDLGPGSDGRLIMLIIVSSVTLALIAVLVVSSCLAECTSSTGSSSRSDYDWQLISASSQRQQQRANSSPFGAAAAAAHANTGHHLMGAGEDDDDDDDDDDKSSADVIKTANTIEQQPLAPPPRPRTRRRRARREPRRRPRRRRQLDRQRRRPRRPRLGAAPQVPEPGRRDNRVGARRNSAAKRRRQVELDLAVNQLHILASLDAQLRAFADSAAQVTARAHRKQQHQHQQQASGVAGSSVGRAAPERLVCELRLPSGWNSTDDDYWLAAGQPDLDQDQDQERDEADLLGGQRLDRPASCLASEQLRRQVPPYMLNLYRQLLAEFAELKGELQQQQQSQLQNTSLPGRLDGSVDADLEQQRLQLFQLPYQSSLMRGLRQPPLRVRRNHHHHHHQQQQAGGKLGPIDGNNKDQDQFEDQDGDTNREREQQDDSKQSDKSTRDSFNLEPRTGRKGNLVDSSSPPPPLPELVVELGANLSGDSSPEPEEPQLDDEAGDLAADLGRVGGACDPSQRLLAAGQRTELCFWFRIGPQLRRKFGHNRRQKPQQQQQQQQQPSSGWTGGQVEEVGPRVERLVEAELHLYKLLPEQQPQQRQFDASPAHQDDKLQLPNVVETKRAAQHANNPSPIEHNNNNNNNRDSLKRLKRTPSSALYHLKTNLLEVSLYQILPRWAPVLANRTQLFKSIGKQQQANSETYPLRLLDIRRIDLDSSGWETFYVKRAVDDWLHDSRLNLGLVIRAKSMFDEPIRSGLIRFVDLYDHAIERAQMSNRTSFSSETEQQQQLQKLYDFDTSHQPLLVIYTTPAR